MEKHEFMYMPHFWDVLRQFTFVLFQRSRSIARKIRHSDRDFSEKRLPVSERGAVSEVPFFRTPRIVGDFSFFSTCQSELIEPELKPGTPRQREDLISVETERIILPLTLPRPLPALLSSDPSRGAYPVGGRA